MDELQYLFPLPHFTRLLTRDTADVLERYQRPSECQGCLLSVEQTPPDHLFGLHQMCCQSLGSLGEEFPHMLCLRIWACVKGSSMIASVRDIKKE
jgi:hypothetical protein